MVKIFDPGRYFKLDEVLASIDTETPAWIRAEILRVFAESPGWSQQDILTSGNISSLIIYTGQQGKNGKIGRLPLSPLRFRVSPEMAHNVFVRYDPRQIYQFFFHLGWNTEFTQKFINEFYSGYLSGG